MRGPDRTGTACQPPSRQRRRGQSPARFAPRRRARRHGRIGTPVRVRRGASMAAQQSGTANSGSSTKSPSATIVAASENAASWLAGSSPSVASTAIALESARFRRHRPVDADGRSRRGARRRRVRRRRVRLARSHRCVSRGRCSTAAGSSARARCERQRSREVATASTARASMASRRRRPARAADRRPVGRRRAAGVDRLTSRAGRASRRAGRRGAAAPGRPDGRVRARRRPASSRSRSVGGRRDTSDAGRPRSSVGCPDAVVGAGMSGAERSGGRDVGCAAVRTPVRVHQAVSAPGGGQGAPVGATPIASASCVHRSRPWSASGVVGSAPLTRSLDTACPDAAGIDGACRAESVRSGASGR